MNPNNFILNSGQSAHLEFVFAGPPFQSREVDIDILVADTYDRLNIDSRIRNRIAFRHIDFHRDPIDIPINSTSQPITYAIEGLHKTQRDGRTPWGDTFTFQQSSPVADRLIIRADSKPLRTPGSAFATSTFFEVHVTIIH